MKRVFIKHSGWFVLVLVLMLSACNQDQDQTTSTAADGSGTIAEIIRNPITAQETEMDASQLAKFSFSEPTFDFGEVEEGDVITHRFAFTNAGEVPLVISDVRSTCGCTVADWPKTPIQPGGSASIDVRFDSKNKGGKQNKPITITANTIPAKTILYLNGFVNAKSQ
ncbi:MAG: DUF1573 domain-containing protein [Saprospiraceae bacterium]